MARKKPRKPRTPISELAAKNSSRKKPKTDRTPKKRQNRRESLRKKFLRKKRAAFPPKTYKNLTRSLPESFGEFVCIPTFLFLYPLHRSSRRALVQRNAGPKGQASREKEKERERERERPGGKPCVWEPRGHTKCAPADKKALGPLWPKQTLEATRNQTGGGLSPSAREGHSTPYPHSGRGSGRDHPRAGLPETRCKAH